MDSRKAERLYGALERFSMEIPSWGFANTGTRFGKFSQPAAATTIEEKFSDASRVHELTGTCPSIALHVQWDLAGGLQRIGEIQRLARVYGMQPGSVNPNLFQDQRYKYGSFGNPDKSIRDMALRHTKDSIEIARSLHSRDISIWFADGSNYPGTTNMRQRKRWFDDNLKACHAEL
jgi:L-rhamnose isomerase/sugar isomerase